MQKQHSMIKNNRGLVEEKKNNRLPAKFDPLKIYLSELHKHPVLSREEEFITAKLVYENQDRGAIEKLAISNLRLVVKIAMTYFNPYLNILDLIQEGNVGLIHAAKKYNPYKRTKFSTYAQFWIRAYILKYIMDSWSLVKVGTTQSQRKLFFRLNKEKRRLEDLGLYPSPKALAQTLQVKEEEVKEMETRLTHNDIYLENPLNEEGGDTMMDLLATDEDVEEIVSEKDTLDLLGEAITAFKTTLNEKEVCILDHRLMAEAPKTLEEIGTRFNISRERVRQIEKRILAKAKTSLNEDLAKLDIWQVCSKTVPKASITARTL